MKATRFGGAQGPCGTPQGASAASHADCGYWPGGVAVMVCFGCLSFQLGEFFYDYFVPPSPSYNM